MNQIPYSLGEIKDYIVSRLDELDDELDLIFVELAEEEHKSFRKLFEIFKGYAELIPSQEGEMSLDLNSLIHFYTTFFNDETYRDHFYFGFRKFYYQSNFDEFNFKIFCYSFVYLLYHLILAKSVDVAVFLEDFVALHEIKLKENDVVSSLMNETPIREEIKDEINTYINLFEKFATEEEEFGKHKVVFYELKSESFDLLLKDIEFKLQDDKLSSFYKLDKDSYTFWDFVTFMIKLSSVTRRDDGLNDLMRLEYFDKTLRRLYD